MRLFPARPAAAAGAAVLLAAGALLSGCGSATVEEGEATDTSVAPLERSSAASGGAAASSASASGASESSSSASRTEEEQDGEPEDRGAREISEIPAPAPAQGPDQDFLAAVAKAGVNVDGVEDQVVGAAQASCQGDAVTAPAVAGQLIEQGRTELSHEELVRLITEQGRKLCAQ